MSEHPIPLTSRQRWLVTAGVMTGMFLAALEGTVVGTAMPTVIASLGGLSHYSWVFSAYLLTATVTVPIWGKLSDLYGRRLLFQIGVFIFLLGSVLSGLAASMPQLIAFRALQGLGAGALVPLAMTIIADIFTLEQRAKMQGLFSGVWGLSSIIGPLVGGWITDHWNWRWVFFINLPFGIISALIIGFNLPSRDLPQKPSIDYAGAATLTASMTLLLLALVEAEGNLLGPVKPFLFLASALFFGLFLWVERRAPEPVIPMQLFRNRVVALGVLIGFLAGVGMFGAISFVPLFAQGVQGATATQAGSLLTPLMLAWVVASIVGGRMLLKFSARPMVVAGMVLMTSAFFIFSFFDGSTPRWQLVADLTLMGTGLGLTMLTLLLAVQHSVPRSKLGVATSLNQFSRSIGGAIGVGVMGAVLSAGMMGVDFDAGVILHGTASAASQVVRDTLAAALRNVFLIGGVACVLALIAALFLPAGSTESFAPSTQRHQGEDLVMAELTTIDPAHEPNLKS